MAKIAILGFGTVGSGVYEVLCRNAAGVSRRAGEPVEVKYILDPKDFSAHPLPRRYKDHPPEAAVFQSRTRLLLPYGISRKILPHNPRPFLQKQSYP